MALLGDDGRGFDLARRLEASGVWRTWLGDSIYLSFNHYLSSPSSWETFMRVDESKSRAQIQLQLRVRALLFDKATASLFLRSNSISASSASSDATSVAVSKLNHNCMLISIYRALFTVSGVELLILFWLGFRFTAARRWCVLHFGERFSRRWVSARRWASPQPELTQGEPSSSCLILTRKDSPCGTLNLYHLYA